MTREEALAGLKATPSKPSMQEAIAGLKAGKAEPTAEAHPALKMIDDVLSAGAQGVYKTAIATPGLPGTIQEWARSLPAQTPAGQWLKDTGESLLSNLPNKGQLPTSQDMLDTYEEKVTPFKKYEGLPAYAERWGEFFTPLPGQKMNLVRDAITAMGGGVGSKGFEDIAEALKASPAGQAWADLIGGITGTVLSKGKKAKAVKIAAKDAPSEAQLNTDATAAYDKVKGVALNKTGFNQALTNIAKAMQPEGLKRRHAPDLFDDLADLMHRRNLKYSDILAVRQEAGRQARAYDPTNPGKSRAAGIVAEQLDKYNDIAAPNNPKFVADINAAKELGRSQSLARDLAEVRRGGEVSQMGEAIGQTNKVRAYTASRKGKSFSPVEEEAVKGAVGRSVRNPLRIFSRGLQSYLTQGAGFGASLMTMSPLPFLATAGAGLLGRGGEALVDKMTLKRLDDIQAAIRAGRPRQEAAALKAAGINKRQWDSLKATGILGTLRSQAIGD